KPRAEIIGFATVSVDRVEMLTGAVLATQVALQKAGLSAQQVDLFECNESFSAVVLNYQQALNIPSEKINVIGGAIARGHALGATGVILLASLLDELERRALEIGCVAMCGGAGVASAMLVRRCR
ncbi:MAG TPA: acetyl-CoA C-acyltransferase, partial [Pseudomonadales bacterium]|nr:acetyl-CoA C-acyltransferase [Pseudomonadales bacterium]